MWSMFKRKNKNPLLEIESLIGEYELPSFSVNLMEILNSLRDPDFSIEAVAKKLEVDPGSHVKVLRIVNSAAFGLRSRVENLRQAISLLGKSRLETIILSQAVSETLPSAKYSFFDMDDFWLQSSRRASLARNLAKIFHPNTQAESFSIGLLQEMALPILIGAKTKEYETIFARWQEDRSSSLSALEGELLGYDHFVIGGLLSESWQLPQYLTDAISRNDKNKIEEAPNLVALLRLDDEEFIRDTLIKKLIEKHGIPEEKSLALIEEALENAKELSSSLSS